jgi:nucleoside 2-deoxyribosyltransferase
MLAVYISGALMGASDLQRVRKLYEALASVCERQGCTAYLPHRNTDPETAASLSTESVVEQDIAKMSEADVILAYLGEPSLGVGAEIAMAVQQGKHILALYESSRKVSRFIKGLLSKYPKSRVYEFDTEEAAFSWVGTELNAISQPVSTDYKSEPLGLEAS